MEVPEQSIKIETSTHKEESEDINTTLKNYLRVIVQGEKGMSQIDLTAEDPNLSSEQVKQISNEYWLLSRAVYEARNGIKSLLPEAAERSGLPAKPSEGNVRIYRGVEWPWNNKLNWSNAYWSEDFYVAQIFAESGDIVVCDIAEEDLYRVKDPSKAGELQIPDTQTTDGAVVILRNNAFRNNEGKLPRVSIKSLAIHGILTGNKRMVPKQYGKLHDEWVKDNPGIEQ